MPTAPGTYQVIATVASDANYNGASSAAYGFTINKAASTIGATGTITYTYTGSAQGPATSTVTGSTATPTYSYSGTGSTTYGPSTTLPTAPGTYQVIATVASDANYNGASSAAYGFTINKGASTIVATGSTSFNYTGSAQGPASSTVTGSTGTVTYSYSGTGATIYGPSATPPTEAGTYQVVATVASDANYNGASATAYTFIINAIPQASLDAYYTSLISTDTVVLKMSFTAGVAPYTVFISNSLNANIDTIYNVVDYNNSKANTIKLNPIKNDAIFKLEKVIDANNQIRTTGFTKDTAQIAILYPKVALTLKANTPTKDPDNSYKLKLLMNVKNEGQLDLNNVQVDANLAGVFPAGMIYKLDSVKSRSSSIKINPNYTGLGNGKAVANIENRQVSASAYIKSFATSYGNYLFDNGVQLAIGNSGQVDFYFSIVETNIETPLKLQFGAAGYGTLKQPDYVSTTDATASFSHDATNPDLNPDIIDEGVPVPTIVPLFPIERLGTALQGSNAKPVPGGYIFHLVAKVKNYSNMNLDSLSLIHDFTKVFKAPDSAFIVNTPVVSGFMKYNNSFDGYNNKSLISIDGTLAYKDSAQINYDIFIKTSKLNNTWLNNLSAFGHSTLSGNLVKDSSTNGINPDPNGDNKPLENFATPLFIEGSLPEAPKVMNGNYVYLSSTTPKDLRSLVKSYPIGTIPVWCDAVTLVCDSVAPKMPVIIGKYIYQLKSYDTANYLYSDEIAYDTVTIRPPAPSVLDSTYIVGLKTNPANIAIQYAILDNATPKFYIGNTTTSNIPTLPNIAGVYKYTLSQVVNNIEGDTISFKVTMLNLTDIIHLQKIVDSGKLQSNSTFNYPFTFIVTNYTKYPFSNVVITDNLHNSVPITSSFSVISNSATGGLIANKQFDGNNDINVTAQSNLSPFAIDTARFTMNLVPKGYNGNLTNIAYVKADTKWGTITLQSSSSAVRTTTDPTSYYVRDLAINIPEGFSPNRDGVHDYFVIIKPYNITLDLQVYNRWGNLVYANNNYKNEWNGKGTGNFAGQDLVDGGYYYTLKAIDDKGTIKTFSGFVVIQR